MSSGNSQDWFELLNQLHLWPFLTASVAIGFLGTTAMLLTSALRMLGEVSDAYYEFRRRCLQAKQRFQVACDIEKEIRDTPNKL